MTRKKAAEAEIPQFALYGETTPDDELEFVHIEDIHERSSRNGWVIKPHRHMHLFQVLCMSKGEMQMGLDSDAHTLKGAWTVVMPVGVVHGFQFRPDTQGVVLSIAVKLQGLDAENQVGRLLDGVLAQPQVLRLHKGAGDDQQLWHYLQEIKLELVQQKPEQRLALFALVKLVLLTLRRRILHEQRQVGEQKPGVQLTDRFRELLEQHYKAHWPIADYADALHVSVSTLNRVCVDVLGDSAKKLLQQRLHVEAKRRLTYTRETLDQIAFNLGFQDAAYFSRVFKAQQGMSPKTFRLQASRT
ncbi:MAG: helix-turn-helix domain-containing protein [Pseudomonadota bacterium]